MKNIFDFIRNANGTFNSAAMMAGISGRTEAQINWIWGRTRHLILNAGLAPKEAADIAMQEVDRYS